MRGQASAQRLVGLGAKAVHCRMPKAVQRDGVELVIGGECRVRSHRLAVGIPSLVDGAACTLLLSDLRSDAYASAAGGNWAGKRKGSAAHCDFGTVWEAELSGQGKRKDQRHPPLQQ
jgi:hypothetical protein